MKFGENIPCGIMKFMGFSVKKRHIPRGKRWIPYSGNPSCDFSPYDSLHCIHVGFEI